MADSVEVNETTPVVEKETVTSSVKESPVKEKNGTEENGTHKNGTAPKENGSSDNGKEKEHTEEEEEEDEEEPKENGDADACPTKRKSSAADAETAEVTTPEKKQKLAEAAVEESEEGVEA